MATCKDCLHYDVCKIIHFPSMFGLTGDGCDHFKNKSDFQEVKHGKWDDNIIGFCNVCTECGAIVDRYSAIKNNSGKLNYCPNCGAKMDGV